MAIFTASVAVPGGGGKENTRKTLPMKVLTEIHK
jgi:hypothetical protein